MFQYPIDNGLVRRSCGSASRCSKSRRFQTNNTSRENLQFVSRVTTREGGAPHVYRSMFSNCRFVNLPISSLVGVCSYMLITTSHLKEPSATWDAGYAYFHHIHCISTTPSTTIAIYAIQHNQHVTMHCLRLAWCSSPLERAGRFAMTRRPCTRQPLVVSADPLINITLTCNASYTYALIRKLGYCKSCWWCSSMARKTYPIWSQPISTLSIK